MKVRLSFSLCPCDQIEIYKPVATKSNVLISNEVRKPIRRQNIITVNHYSYYLFIHQLVKII